MRYFNYLLAILVIANIALLLMPDKSNLAPHIHNAKPEVNTHFVRLNKEIEQRFYGKEVTTPALIDAPSEFDDSNGSDGISSEYRNGQSVCYRVGPFLHRSNYELAQAVLMNAGVRYTKSRRRSQESNVYRLYLGPFATREEVADVRVDLKRKKILDHFVRKDDDGVFIISLGIYSTLTTAETALQLFVGKLDSVKMKDETVVLPESYWLHFSLAEDARAQAQLREIDWGETSVKMGPYKCVN